jgi:hypothetical protein
MGKRYYIILGVLALLFIVVNSSSPSSVSWKPTYKKKDKNPYGAEVTYALLKDIYGEENVGANNASPYDYLHNDSSEFNMIYIASNVTTSETDEEAIMEFAERGNNVFIAANFFVGPLADTLGLTYTDFHDTPLLSSDSVSLSFTNPGFERTEYWFNHDHVVNYIIPDTTKKREWVVLSQSSDYQPHFIKVPVGEGNIYYHSNPLIFTNYNILHVSAQYKYISNCLSYLPRKKTIWSEYYTMGASQESETQLRFILQSPQLRWGYYILAAFIIVFLIFQSKRRQRAIPVVKPPKNSTLEFVETTGRLYFQQKNHANLAVKKIAFFLEKVRTRFYIPTNLLDDHFIETLASKSGVPQEEIRQLVIEFDRIKKAEQITESQLLELNKKIESFYTKASL